MELASASLGAEGPHGLHKGKVSLDCNLLGLLSWVVSPGVALQGLLLWGFSLLDCPPLDCTLLGFLSGIALLGSFPRDCSPVIAL